MRGGLLRSGFAVVMVTMVLSACSNIIGISSYEVDPALDEGAAGRSSIGGVSSGGGTTAIEGGAAAGGDDTGLGGMITGGRATTGGEAAGGSGTAGSPLGGEGGEGGEGGAPTPSGCGSANDCDDTIDCTVDSCRGDGTCTHTPDDAACSPLAGNCAVCTGGIGCVETPGTVTELLLDPGFDLKSGNWVDSRDGLPASVIVDAAAQTPGNSVRLGPTGNNATQQGFTDLAQQITIPKNAILLVVSGYYKLTPGKVGDPDRDAVDDYTTLTLFSLADENDDYIRFQDYNEWYGDDVAQAMWKPFSYTTTKSVLAKVLDQAVTLDLVTETWDTRFSFDSLSLKVTTCE